MKQPGESDKFTPSVAPPGRAAGTLGTPAGRPLAGSAAGLRLATASPQLVRQAAEKPFPGGVLETASARRGRGDGCALAYGLASRYIRIVSNIRIETVEPPFDHPATAASAVRLLCRAESVGAFAPSERRTVLDRALLADACRA